MAWFVFLVSIFAAGGVAPTARSVSDPVFHFRITIDRSDSGFVARCDTGCTWTALSLSCDARCRPLIDANGVYLSPVASPRQAPFAFRFEATANGWKAESVRGTAWLALSYGCGPDNCAAWIDEFGVHGGAPR